MRTIYKIHNIKNLWGEVIIFNKLSLTEIFQTAEKCVLTDHYAKSV